MTGYHTFTAKKLQFYDISGVFRNFVPLNKSPPHFCAKGQRSGFLWRRAGAARPTQPFRRAGRPRPAAVGDGLQDVPHGARRIAAPTTLCSQISQNRNAPHPSASLPPSPEGEGKAEEKTHFWKTFLANGVHFIYNVCGLEKKKKIFQKKWEPFSPGLRLNTRTHPRGAAATYINNKNYKNKGVTTT